MEEQGNGEIRLLIDIFVPLLVAVIAGVASYVASWLQIRELKNTEKAKQSAAFEALGADILAMHERMDRYFMDVQHDNENENSLDWLPSMDLREPMSFLEPQNWKTIASTEQYDAVQRIRVKMDEIRYNIPTYLRGNRSKIESDALARGFQECLNVIESTLSDFNLETP